MIAVLSVLCSVLVGVLTNLITQKWSVTLGIALGAVVLVAAALAWRDRSASPASRHLGARHGPPRVRDQRQFDRRLR